MCPNEVQVRNSVETKFTKNLIICLSSTFICPVFILIKSSTYGLRDLRLMDCLSVYRFYPLSRVTQSHNTRNVSREVRLVSTRSLVYASCVRDALVFDMCCARDILVCDMRRLEKNE